MASQNNLRVLFDWIQIQLFINEPLDTIIHNILGIPSDYFFLKQGKIEHYDYDHVVEYGASVFTLIHLNKNWIVCW
ncbi:hypothetical protein IW492_17340 [Enterococcus sp. BWB1-3]|uniref:hypothetical protein n=1 Tax=Enterococcus sp. BWB1-3 TaxID=2787713 RepID=UPI001921899B|nr:hypothetical protein [Enterococcus sp. BWB1-3]MBL1230991.1 hypothetical protein [Enterococcus sp. BWB1-3]